MAQSFSGATGNWKLSCGVRAFASLDEERLEQVAAFGLAYSSGDGATMIQGRELKQVQSSAGSPGFRVVDSENNPGQTNMDTGSGTHRTRFLGHVQGAIGQAPISDGFLGGGNREHLGMC